MKNWFYAILILALGMSFTACTNEEFDDEASDFSGLELLSVTSEVEAVSKTKNDMTLIMNIKQGLDVKIERYGFCCTQDPAIMPTIYNATTLNGEYTGFNEFSPERCVRATLENVKANDTYYVCGYVILASTHQPVYTEMYKVEIGNPIYVEPAEESAAE